MHDLSMGPARTETVYDGPEAFARAARASSKGNGNTETVYSGLGTQTVFDESTFTAKRIDSSLARKAVTSTIRWSSLRFFLVAALSLIEFLLYRDESDEIAFISGATFLVFLAVGVYAYKLSRVAFLVALGIYGLSTTCLAIYAMTTEFGIFLVIKPMIARCILLYSLYRNYGLLTDLHLLENE